MKFEKLEQKSINEVERMYSKQWDDNKIFEKSVDSKSKNNNYVFYDGPATANGMPGIHHMMAKLLKDTVCKYKTMQGFRVVRKVGWDTHGLPVEVAVEKDLTSMVKVISKNTVSKNSIKNVVKAFGKTKNISQNSLKKWVNSLT